MSAPADKNVKALPLTWQLAACLAGICFIAGAFAVWDVIFPEPMTASCAHLIEQNPPSLFSGISEQQREATLECLYLKRKYRQTAWTVNPNFIFRKGD